MEVTSVTAPINIPIITPRVVKMVMRVNVNFGCRRRRERRCPQQMMGLLLVMLEQQQMDGFLVVAIGAIAAYIVGLGVGGSGDASRSCSAERLEMFAPDGLVVFFFLPGLAI